MSDSLNGVLWFVFDKILHTLITRGLLPVIYFMVYGCVVVFSMFLSEASLIRVWGLGQVLVLFCAIGI